MTHAPITAMVSRSGGCFAALVAVALCQASPPRFLWHYGLSYSDMISMSQVIVVAQVQSIDFVGPVIRATDDHDYSSDWQLVRVKAASENVLKGQISQNQLEFFYYTSLGPASGNWNALRVGDRCVFFFVLEQGILRAVRDFWRSSIEVGSGRHGTPASTEPAAVNEQVVRLLLTPGSDLQPTRFSRLLPQDVAIADELVGPCKTTAVLRALLDHANNEVRSAAAGQLASRLQTDCEG